MEVRSFKIKLTYFKESGKFYESSEVTREFRVCEDGRTCYMYDVLDWLRKLRREQSPMPGLVGSWMYDIVVECEDGFPIMLPAADRDHFEHRYQELQRLVQATCARFVDRSVVSEQTVQALRASLIEALSSYPKNSMRREIVVTAVDETSLRVRVVVNGLELDEPATGKITTSAVVLTGLSCPQCGPGHVHTRSSPQHAYRCYKCNLSFVLTNPSYLHHGGADAKGQVGNSQAAGR